MSACAYGLCIGEATHRALATCSTAWILRRDGVRVGHVHGEAKCSLLRGLARFAWKLHLLAADTGLGVKLARTQLDDVLVASLALAELELVCDAVAVRHLLHQPPANRRLRMIHRAGRRLPMIHGGGEKQVHLYLRFIHTLVTSSAGLTQLSGDENPCWGCQTGSAVFSWKRPLDPPKMPKFSAARA